MIKINLIPYHEKEKKEDLARQIAVMAGAFLLFILCLVSLVGVNFLLPSHHSFRQ